MVVDTADLTWRWVVSLAFPPFSFELTLAQSERPTDEAHPFCNIGAFLEHPNNTTAQIELDQPVTLAHTIFPTDWRSRAHIEANLDLYGRTGS